MKKLFAFLIAFFITTLFTNAQQPQLPDNIDTITDCIGIPEPSEFQINEVWRSNHVVNSYTTPIVGDIDGDDKSEIISVIPKYGDLSLRPIDEADMLTTEHYYVFDSIVIFNGNNRGNVTVFKTVEGRNLSVGALAMCKVNISGTEKVLIFMVGKADNKLYAYDARTASSTPVWVSNQPINLLSPQSYNEGVFSTAINIADFDGDGTAEVYVGDKIYAAESGILLCEAPSGAMKAANTYNNAYGNRPCFQQHSIAADVVGDSNLELCLASQVFSVNIVSRQNHYQNSLTLVSSLDYQNPSIWARDGKTIVADIDQDGLLDIIYYDANDFRGLQIVAWNPRSGNSIAYGGYRINVYNSAFLSLPLVANIDNTTDLEIVQISDSRISAYRLNRTTQQFDIVYTLTVNDPSSGTGITVFDFNQDGIGELVYRDETQLRILNTTPNGSFIDKATFTVHSGTGFEYPVVADVDNDNQAEIVISGADTDFPEYNRYSGSIRIYKSGGAAWAPARNVWNQYGYNVVNINKDLTVPSVQFNPATLFAGADNQMNTADDIRPFNAFLQQQTSIYKNGTSFWKLPEKTREIHTTICKGGAYDFYGRNITEDGIYTHRIDMEGECDSVITLFLSNNASDTTKITDNICDNSTYTFNGQTISEAGTYTANLSNTLGCDSIVVLTLVSKPTFVINLKDSIYECEYYQFGERQINKSGTYRDTLVSTSGCDSILQLELKVKPDQLEDSIKICSDQLPLEVYDTIFPIGSQSGTYILHDRCATITYKLQVTYEIEIDGVDIPEICADASSFEIVIRTTNSTTATLPETYEIKFDTKSTAAGFIDKQDKMPDDHKISIDIPQNIKPDYYHAQITFGSEESECAEKTMDIDIPVFYSKTIIEQMWNDVLALLNNRYNGGYTFSYYEWYKNGIVLNNENKSYIYLEAGNILDTTAIYQAKPTRVSDNISIFSCGLKPIYQTNISEFPTLIGGADKYRIKTQNETLNISFITTTGIVISHYTINPYSEMDIYYPTTKGLYFMIVHNKNKQQNKTYKIVVR